MPKSAIKSIFLLVSCFCFSATTLTFTQPSRFSNSKYISDKGDTLNYRLLSPDYNPTRRYPLVIFLHGSGERGNDNEAQLKWGVMNFATDQAMAMHPAIVIAPQCPDRQSWANFKNDEKSREMRLQGTPARPLELVIQLIQKMIKEMNVDPARIYITGLSMGGFGTFDAIERYPDLFAAAVPVCGGGDISRAASIVNIPIWILHGSEDPAVNPEFSLEMAQALVKAGGHPGLTLYPETGHFSWLAAYSDPLVTEWMFRQHR